MNGQQKAVLWIGLILVGLNVVSQWSTVVGIIFNGAGITGGIPTPSGSGSGSGGGLTIPLPTGLLPGGELLPGHITIPTAKTKAKKKPPVTVL